MKKTSLVSLACATVSAIALLILLVALSGEMVLAQAPELGENTGDGEVEIEGGDSEPLPDEVDSEEESGFEYLDEAVVREAHREVLARQEFERLQDAPEDDDAGSWQWFEDFLDWLGELFERDGGQEVSTGRTLPGLRGVIYLAAALAIAAVLIGVVFLVLERRSKHGDDIADADARDTNLATPPGHLAPNDYLRRAGELASKGDYRLAVRELLLGSMSYLERTGAIRYRRGLTNRDYYRSAKGHRRDGIRVIIGHFERIFYGRRAATREHYIECAQKFRDGFVEAPEPG